MQLASNKDQLQKYSLRIEDRDGEITSLKDTIKSMERQLMTSFKAQLLEAEESFNAQQQKHVMNGDATKVCVEIARKFLCG